MPLLTKPHKITMIIIIITTNIITMTILNRMAITIIIMIITTKINIKTNSNIKIFFYL